MKSSFRENKISGKLCGKNIWENTGNLSGYELLAIAIVQKAAEDYRSERKNRREKTTEAKRIERFFKSEYGDMLSLGCGEVILEKLQKEFKENCEVTDHEILETAIKCFGEEEQERLATEECAELIQAINRKHRGREHNIAEEIADVEIMLEQLKIINGCEKEVADFRQKKIDRLFERVFDSCL